MWQPALAATLLFLSQVSAGVVGDVRRVVRRGAEVEESMRRSVEKIVEPVERRQNPPKMNVTQWDEQTMAACTSALEMLKGQASNDAGMAVCYNLPFLDSATGVFQADLRLFTISTPQKSFAGIPSQNISVGLSYVGATVSPVNASAIGRREEGHSLISWPRHEMEKRQNTAAPVPQMAQAYAFVGQINKDLLSTNMDAAALETLLVPTVTLTGTDSNGLQVKAILNPGEATFVSGQFAQPIIATKAQVQAPIQTLVVQSGAPFVVPGLHILIFPIGGVITGIWAILFIGTIAYGTYGRMQFRESYRRRSARADKGTVARI